MNGTVFVYAGWLSDDPLIGELEIVSVRGRESVSFSYDRKWVSQHRGLLLDPDVEFFSGRQFPPADKRWFGFLSDTSPDRWGRKLMERREIIHARKENRSIRKLFESDYMLGVIDEARTGGFRFKSDPDGPFLSHTQELAVPPMTELRRLEQSSISYEKSTDPYEEKWFRDLIAPGSSLGGARPKANVTDPNGNYWIAKFPSHKDSYNVGAWEMVVHEMAEKCGIAVPEAMVRHLSENGDTFLVRRFDRQPADDHKLRRIHFASAMTMLGETDGSDHPISYLNIAEFLESYGADAEQDLRQLWRRIVFNIAVTNADDHLRNHGFLLLSDGWHLSPAYDINPAYDSAFLSLNITEEDNSRDMDLALETSEYYRVPLEEARSITEEIRKIVRENWQPLAAKYRIPNAEQEMMRQAFAQAI